MQIKLWMTKLKRDDSVMAIGALSLGEITVKNLMLMKNKDGELFLQMPCRDTGRMGPNGAHVYEDIIHPTTRQMRDALNEAALESYENERPVTLKQNTQGTMLIEASAFDAPYMNRVGKGQILINDEFVIKDIFINKGKNDGLYITLPNYKSKESHNGKPVYKEIVTMGSDLKKQVSRAMIDEYHKSVTHKEQNRFTIKSRLNEAKKKADEQTAHKEHTKENMMQLV